MPHSAEVEKTISGLPLPIFVEEKGKFRLQEQNLKKILLREDVKDSPVMILSIAGALREGKSFILNFIIRYLRSSMKENWLGDETSSLSGFSWRGGLDRNTMGMMMWSEPFQIDTANGKLSVLLMDTQGLFDDESTMNDIKTIFCMSFLLSSFQVYNVMKMIKDDMMQCFTTFLEYAKMAETPREKHYLLQRLMFLVRDWPDETAHKYGEIGGQDYITNYVKAKNSILKTTAEKLLCFLLPSPGRRVCETRCNQKPFVGALKDIDQKFVEILPELMQTFFSPENIVPKSVKGQLLTGKDLMTYARNLDDIFSGDELPKAEDVSTTIKSAFYGALKEEFLAKYRKIMDESVGSGGKTEDEFLQESTKTISYQLKEYDARPKYGDVDDIRRQKEVREILQREQKVYIQKHRNKREDLRKKCVRLAEEKCALYESRLKKKFGDACCKRETLAEAFEIATRNALDALPDLVRDSAFDRLFRSTILKGMEKVANNLDEQNDARLRKMEEILGELKLQCERFVEDKMKKMIQQKMWTSYEIPRCKRNLVTATSDRWDILSKKVNGPVETLDEYKKSLMSKTKELISSFEGKNRQSKDQLDRDAVEEVKGILGEYESLMMKEMGREAHVRQDMEKFHRICSTESLKSERLQHLRPYLREKTTQLFYQKVRGEFEKLMEKNAMTAEAQRQRCYTVKSNCIKEAERLMDESCGRRFLDDLNLQDCVKRIERRIMQKFDSDCPTRIDYIQGTPRRQLEQYFERELPKLAAEKNNHNEMLMEKEVEAVTHLMQTEAGLQFENMLGSGHSDQSRLKMVDDVVRNKLDDIIDNKCTSETAKERCRERVDQMLINEREKWNKRRLEAERQREEKALEIKSECLRTYRKRMEEVMKDKIEDYLLSSFVIEASHLAVMLEITVILGRQRHIVDETVKKEILHSVKEVKEELLETAHLMEQNIQRTKIKLRKFYVTTMENKLGGHCSNDSDLKQYERESIDAVDDMRKDSGVEFKMPTLLLLGTQMEGVRKWNVQENEKFRRRCHQSAMNIIEEYRELPTGIRERHTRDATLRNNEIEKRLQSFRSSLKGNRDTIEEYSAFIKKKLEELSTPRGGLVHSRGVFMQRSVSYSDGTGWFSLQQTERRFYRP